MLRSLPPVAIERPSGLQSQRATPAVCPVSVVSVVPVLGDQIRAVLSYDELSRCWPSGLQATPLVGPVCPSSTFSELPDSTSQMRTVLSMPHEANCVPSGEKARSRTANRCPLRL